MLAAASAHTAHRGVQASSLAALLACAQGSATLKISGEALPRALEAAFAALEMYASAADVQLTALRLLHALLFPTDTVCLAPVPSGLSMSTLAVRILLVVVEATQEHPAHEALQLSALTLLARCVDNKLLTHAALRLADVVPLAVAALARATAAQQRADARAAVAPTTAALVRGISLLHFHLEERSDSLRIAAAEAGVHAVLADAMRVFTDVEAQERCCKLLYHACIPLCCHARAVDAAVLAALVRAVHAHTASRTICFLTAATAAALLAGPERERVRADVARALAALVAHAWVDDGCQYAYRLLCSAGTRGSAGW